MKRLTFDPLGPYLDKVKGSRTSKYKIERKKDYWKVALAKFEQSKSLLRILPLRHSEKVSRKVLALSIPFGESWEAVEPRIQNLRFDIRAKRDLFVQKAGEEFISSHSK